MSPSSFLLFYYQAFLDVGTETEVDVIVLAVKSLFREIEIQNNPNRDFGSSTVDGELQCLHRHLSYFHYQVILNLLALDIGPPHFLPAIFKFVHLIDYAPSV